MYSISVKIPTHIQVLLALAELRHAVSTQPLLNHRIRALTVQNTPALNATYHRHSLPHIIKIQDIQHLIGPLLAQDLNRDALRRAALEHKPEIPSGGHERRLVRRLRLVRQAHALLHLRHHRVADTQQREEPVARLIAASDLLEQGAVVEAEIGLEVRVPRKVQRLSGLADLDLVVVLVVQVAVHGAVDGALVEGHDVLGERARLVAEDVLDLAEFFVEGGGARLGGYVAGLVVHLDVPVDPQALDGADELDADVEGDGHDRVQDDQVGEEDEQGDDGGARVLVPGVDEPGPGEVGLEGVAAE